ncbi:glycosyltransferase [Shewanella olleyana]|uniref:glycosyltransferase n=1 Tax=Shewanella olleyana TaxID=135626 RepID=UPI00200C941E|nr:glycosyltransferase [Shewanella olleyana]MCL1067023.1 glycosyltransferase [Shewanella olleyana]
MKISIIIPMYNASEYLVECIDSIKAQTEKDFELIVIDDGSTDNSVELIKHHCADLNFILIEQENAGASAARNVGISKATGDFICFVDSDDILTSAALYDLYNRITEAESDVVIGRRGWIIDDQYEPNPDLDTKLFNKDITNCNVYEYPALLNVIAVHSKLYRTKFLHDNNLLFKEGISSEDFIFSYQVALLTDNFSTFRGNEVYYYRRRSGVTKSITQERLSEFNLNSRFIQMDETYKLSQTEKGKHLLTRDEVKLNFQHRLVRHIRELETNDEQSLYAFKIIKQYVEKNIDLINSKCNSEYRKLYSLISNGHLDWVVDYIELLDLRKEINTLNKAKNFIK